MESGNRFLEQGVYFNQNTSMLVNESSTRKSKNSGKLSDGGGGERSWWNDLSGDNGYGQIMGAGGWLDGDGDFFEGVGYKADLGWLGE